MGTTIDEQEVVRNAEAAVWSGERVWNHVRAEFTNDIDKVMSTVARGVSIQYAIPHVEAGGAMVLDVITTLEGALGHYQHVREVHDILDWQAFVELRSEWCLFFDGVVTHRDAGTGAISRGRSVVFFVLSDQEGITGELAWPCVAVGPNADNRTVGRSNGGREATVPQTRLDNLAMHQRYLDALKAGDLETVLGFTADDVEAGIRSYVGDRPFVELHGKDAMRRHYQDHSARHRVRDVSLVNIVADEWYVYSELLWDVTVTGPALPERDVRFRTADVLVLDSDGRIKARIGYGTDPA